MMFLLLRSLRVIAATVPRYCPRFLMIETRQLRSLAAVCLFLCEFIGITPTQDATTWDINSAGPGQVESDLSMKTKTHFAFRVDIWDDTGDSIVEHVAGGDDFEVAVTTYWAAVTRWPLARITLRQGACIIHERAYALYRESSITRCLCFWGCACWYLAC